MPGFPVHHHSWSLPKLMSMETVMSYSHLILCCPLLFLPSVFPSIRVFSNESALHIRWLKYWNLSFSISPPNKYSGLISFRIDWFDFLAVQWILKSLLQHHSSKTSILQCSALFIIQLSHLYTSMGFPHSSSGKESSCNTGDLDSIPGLGRSLGEGKGYPLQYSGLENSRNYIVHGGAKSQT